MKKIELQNEIDNVTMELRSLMDSVKDTTKPFNEEEVRARKEALEARKTKAEKELAEIDRPETETETRNKDFEIRNWIEAAKEKRSITIGSTGAINQVKQLFKDVADGNSILGKATYYYGANAATMIPVLAPIADPSDYSEGETGVTVDTAASVAVTKLEPRAYAAVLPISAEMLTMGVVNLEAELPSIFEKAFTKVMHKEMLQGSSTGMKGIFTSAAETGATIVATGANITNLANLALQVSAKDEAYSIVLSPAHYQTILSDSTDGEDIKLYKESLIRDKSIEGVPVVIDNQALSSTSSGAVMVVAAPLARYCIGVAGDIQIDPIKVKGDTNTYYQATMFFNGKQLSSKDLYTIVHA